MIDKKYHRFVKEPNRPSNLSDEWMVGKGATVNLFTDRHAYTIIGRTKKTLVLRRCHAILDKNWKPDFIPGGFAGHVTNNHEQTYSYKENEQGEIVTAYWSEKKKGFYVRKVMFVTPGRHEFYDFNF